MVIILFSKNNILLKIIKDFNKFTLYYFDQDSIYGMVCTEMVTDNQ